MDKRFRDYKPEASNWITLASGDFYPDILVDACNLYKPVLEIFGQLIKSSETSERLFFEIQQEKQSWMRIQLTRVSDRGGSQEDDRISGNMNVSNEILKYAWIGIDNSSEAINHIFKRFIYGVQEMGDFVNNDHSARQLLGQLNLFPEAKKDLNFEFLTDKRFFELSIAQTPLQTSFTHTDRIGDSLYFSIRKLCRKYRQILTIDVKYSLKIGEKV